MDVKLKPYIWTDDITTSKMVILPSYKFEPRTVSNRPSILVARGPLQIQEFALDNRAIPHVEPTGNFKGVDRYVNLQGQHEIHCIGSAAMESDRIAEEVFFRMLEYYPSIRDDLNFSDFKVTLLGGLSKLEEYDEQYVTSIKVAWQYVHGWTLTAIAPVLKKAGYYNPLESL